MKKKFNAHIILAATALASQQVWALGFGRAVSDAVLGQSFTFTVPVHVDPGERFGADCVAADVYYGENLLPPGSVRSEIDRGTDDNNWLVRITARVPVEEPIVEVALRAGCERRFTRRFTLFADPPTLGTTAAQLPKVAGGSAPSTASPVAPVPADARASPRGSGGAGAAGAVAAAMANHRASGAGTGHSRVQRKGPTMALANELGASAGSASARPVPDASANPKPGSRPSAATAPRLVLAGGYAHLKLDIDEPVFPAAAGASGATIGLSDLDDPAARQLRALEQSIQAVKRDSQASHDQAVKLQAQLAEAQSHSDWMPWIVGLLAAAVAALAGMAWKLRQLSKSRHPAWFNESQVSSNMPLPPVTAPPAAATPPVPKPIPDPQDADADPEAASVAPPARSLPHGAVVTDPTATLPFDRRAMAALMATESAPRELSVEELLDLEQQADFFIALGQEDAAVDLLMSHLRSAGGQSPLPYTKLLEIYRRQGDRSAYERTRARFNRRFNAYAPDWDTGPASGRTLEDYPDTIALLEGAWRSPIDAMAILEGLLFKRDDTSELFDLPAYRDVLVLYSLARDLWQHGGGSTSTQVDVLLPLDDVGAAPQVPYPSARQFNDFDPYSPSDAGMRTSFEMTGYAGHGGGSVDLELPGGAGSHAGDPLFGGQHDDGVHATLDALSLAPVEPARRKPAPHDWDDSGSPSDTDLPTKR